MARYAAHPRYNDYVQEYYAKNANFVPNSAIASLQELRRAVEAGAYARKMIDVCREEAYQYFQEKNRIGGGGSEPKTGQSTSNELRESVKDIYNQSKCNYDYLKQKNIKSGVNIVSEQIFPRFSNIYHYKEIIKDVAMRNKVPPELLGGILYNEANYANYVMDQKHYVPIIGGIPTVGIAQVSPHSSLAEKAVGFDPERNDYLVQKYAKITDSIGVPITLEEISTFRDKNVIDSMRTYRNAKINELKKLITKYYQGNADNNDVNILREVFKGDKNISFTNNKQQIIAQVNEELQRLKNDQYSIEYLGKLVRRIANDKLYTEYNLSDEQMREIAKQFNSRKFDNSSVYYYDQFKDALPRVRAWLK